MFCEIANPYLRRNDSAQIIPKPQASESPGSVLIKTLPIAAIQRDCSLRVHRAKTLKFSNKNAFFAVISLFVARCASYTYKLRNEGYFPGFFAAG
jgi:hypothetical protein